MGSEDAQGHGEHMALLVCDGLAPCFNRGSDNGARSVEKGVAVGRKEDQSLTVDLQNNSIKHGDVKRL